MKIICVKGGVNNLMKNDHRSYYATFAVAKKKAEKKININKLLLINSGLYRIRTLDLCDTGAVLYQLS